MAATNAQLGNPDVRIDVTELILQDNGRLATSFADHSGNAVTVTQKGLAGVIHMDDPDGVPYLRLSQGGMSFPIVNVATILVLARVPVLGVQTGADRRLVTLKRNSGSNNIAAGYLGTEEAGRFDTSATGDVTDHMATNVGTHGQYGAWHVFALNVVTESAGHFRLEHYIDKGHVETDIDGGAGDSLRSTGTLLAISEALVGGTYGSSGQAAATSYPLQLDIRQVLVYSTALTETTIAAYSELLVDEYVKPAAKYGPVTRIGTFFDRETNNSPLETSEKLRIVVGYDQYGFEQTISAPYAAASGGTVRDPDCLIQTISGVDWLYIAVTKPTAAGGFAAPFMTSGVCRARVADIKLAAQTGAVVTVEEISTIDWSTLGISGTPHTPDNAYAPQWFVDGANTYLIVSLNTLGASIFRPYYVQVTGFSPFTIGASATAITGTGFTTNSTISYIDSVITKLATNSYAIFPKDDTTGDAQVYRATSTSPLSGYGSFSAVTGSASDVNAVEGTIVHDLSAALGAGNWELLADAYQGKTVGGTSVTGLLRWTSADNQATWTGPAQVNSGPLLRHGGFVYPTFPGTNEVTGATLAADGYTLTVTFSKNLSSLPIDAWNGATVRSVTAAGVSTPVPIGQIAGATTTTLTLLLGRFVASTETLKLSFQSSTIAFSDITTVSDTLDYAVTNSSGKTSDDNTPWGQPNFTDSFVRANGAIGNSWTTRARFGVNTATIVSNKLLVTMAANYLTVWRADSFQTQKAYWGFLGDFLNSDVNITNVGLFLRADATAILADAGTGYIVRLNYVSANTVTVEMCSTAGPGSESTLTGTQSPNPSVNKTITTGKQYRLYGWLQVTPDGTVLHVQLYNVTDGVSAYDNEVLLTSGLLTGTSWGLFVTSSGVQTFNLNEAGFYGRALEAVAPVFASGAVPAGGDGILLTITETGSLPIYPDASAPGLSATRGGVSQPVRSPRRVGSRDLFLPFSDKVALNTDSIAAAYTSVTGTVQDSAPTANFATTNGAITITNNSSYPGGSTVSDGGPDNPALGLNLGLTLNL